MKEGRYSIVTPSLLHRYSIVSPSFRWSIYGLSMENQWSIYGGKANKVRITSGGRGATREKELSNEQAK